MEQTSQLCIAIISRDLLKVNCTLIIMAAFNEPSCSSSIGREQFVKGPSTVPRLYCCCVVWLWVGAVVSLDCELYWLWNGLSKIESN